MPRDKGLEYTPIKKSGVETDDMAQATQIITDLKGSKARSADKLAQELLNITEEKRRIDELEKQAKAASLEFVEQMFDTADEAYTRVVQTAATVMTLSKKSTSKRSDFQVEKFMAAVAKMTGVAEQELEKMRKKFTKVTESPRASSIKAAELESFATEGLADIPAKLVGVLKTIGQNFMHAMTSWFDDADRLMGEMQKILGNELKYEGYICYLADRGVI